MSIARLVPLPPCSSSACAPAHASPSPSPCLAPLRHQTIELFTEATHIRHAHSAAPSKRWRVCPRAVVSAIATHPDAAVAATSSAQDLPKVLLEVKGLRAVVADTGNEILQGVDLTVREGEIHAIMGTNGSGKSTFSKTIMACLASTFHCDYLPPLMQNCSTVLGTRIHRRDFYNLRLVKVLVGHPDYEVSGGTAIFKGENLFEKEPEERSHAGLFLSFQSPVEVPGVSNMEFLRMACNARRVFKGLSELGPLEFYGFLSPKLAALNMNPSFLDRNVNEGFSGGEKKRNEILQLAVLEADLAILDEIDSGLDVDALRDVASSVNGLRKSSNAVVMITHYQRLLDYIQPTYVHIMESGRIIKTGDASLAKLLEAGGYRAIRGA